MTTKKQKRQKSTTKVVKVKSTNTRTKSTVKKQRTKKKGSRLWIILILAFVAIILVATLVMTFVNNTGVTRITMSEEAAAVAQRLKEHPETSGKLSLTEQYFDETLAAINTRKDQTFPDAVTTENTLDSTISFGALNAIASEDDWNNIDTENLLDTASRVDGSVYTLEHDNYENIVLYLHGGAYAFEIAAEHITFADKLSTELNAKVYLPIYPLAPQATYAETYEILTELYELLLLQDKKIFIMGDSAGGGLAMAFTEYLKTVDLDLPDKVVLLSPWLDVTCSNPEISEYEKKDLTLAAYGPIQLGKIWAGDLDTKDPLVSPIYGDIEDLPGVMTFVGTDEIMYPDDTKFYEMLRNAGNDARLVIGEGFWHVFPVYNIPERDYSIKLIKEFVL